MRICTSAHNIWYFYGKSKPESSKLEERVSYACLKKDMNPYDPMLEPLEIGFLLWQNLSHKENVSGGQTDGRKREVNYNIQEFPFESTNIIK